MRELAIVRGTVVGEPGTLVAGWAALGEKQPPRWVAHVVTIRTETGTEITLEGLTADGILPVHTEEARWSELETRDVAHLFVNAAPAPDVEVELRAAVLRGGEPIVVWGEVTDRGYVGPRGAADGDPLRGSVERGITKLAPMAVATGEDREAVLERARERRLAKERKQLAKERKERKERQHEQDRASDKVETKAPKPSRDPDYVDRTRVNLPLWITLAGLAVVAVLAYATRAWDLALRATTVIATVPLALDAVLLPRFRKHGMRPASLEVPFIGYIIPAALAVMMSYGLSIGDVESGRVDGMRIAQLVALSVVAAAVAWLWLATRDRARSIAMILNAPPHPQPLRDGVWGATDGRFEKQVLSVGETVEVWGKAVKDSSGNRTRNVTTRPFSNVEYEAPLRTGAGTMRVRIAEADTITFGRIDRSTGKDKGLRAEVINDRTPVRVVGRARDGVLVKGGEASLLVFAAPADASDLAVSLRRVHRRLVLARLLALGGAAALVVSFFA